MKFRLGELFCGPGGLALGAHWAEASVGSEYSIEHAWANDIDPSACETYKRNLPEGTDANVICCPVQELLIENLPPIDALAFGFPCNDYSIVGEQRGLSGEYGPLYSYGVKILNHHRPKWFLAENVGGLQNADEGGAFQRIMSELQAAGPGYNLTAHLYKFEQYGVPQYRHRIIIVGIAKELGLQFQVPAPTTASCPVTAYTAIMDPSIAEDAANNELTRQSPVVVERLKHIPAGENAWYSGIPQELRLNVKGATMSQIYRRLDPERPAYTITGSGGGGTHVYHWTEPRALTNRERARLQSFPDDFIFCGTKEQVRKQIGMAVPPLGAAHIFTGILKTFAGMPYPACEAHWEHFDGTAKVAKRAKRTKSELLAMSQLTLS